MNQGLNLLRSDWTHDDYRDIKNEYINASLENLDIEELTLLEWASYQFQTEREGEPLYFYIREEAFRSKLRHQRRIKIDALINDIGKDKQSIYDISTENKDPYFLIKCFFRLTWPDSGIFAIPTTIPLDAQFLKSYICSLNNVLKSPSQHSQDTVHSMINGLQNEEIKCALRNSLSYLIEPALNIERQATELMVKNLLCDENQLYEQGRGSIGDLIISIYKGRQEQKIVKSSNIDWDNVVENVKKSCFRYAERENELNDYALSIYVNDYPGTRESRIERPFWGESIGLGTAIAILAFLKECNIKQGIAFTGNVNANFIVSKVGGFKGNGKAYAACWSGIEKIIVPKDNVKEAQGEVDRALKGRARCNTEVIGVANLSEAEEEIFQSFISPKLDEMAINKFPFPIAYRYKQIPIGEDKDKKELIFQTLIAAMQYLSLIIISQYTIRDADKKEMRNSELAKWFCDEIGKTTETWGITFFKFLRYYLGKYGYSQVELFTKELYDISEAQYDLIEDSVKPAMDLHQNATQGNITEESSQMQIKKYSSVLKMILENFSFIKNYHLIRISKKEDQDYYYHGYTGSEPDTEEHKLLHTPEQELILGQLYLAKPDYSDFLHIHPMLVFWTSPTDVLLYHHLGSEKVNYLPRFMTGFLETTDHFHEINAIYEKLKKEREKKPSFGELDWIYLREGVKENSSDIGEFDSTTYTRRSDVMGVLTKYLDSVKNCLVISGNAGSGKTSFLGNLAYELRDNEDVCVLVYPAENLDQGIEKKLSGILVEDYNGPKDEFLKQLNQTGKLEGKKLIICIDAINEHDNPKWLLKSLNETVETHRYSWLKMIITCRTNVWKRIGPRNTSFAENRYYRHENSDDIAIYLQDFGVEELPEAYEKYRSKYNVRTAYNNLSPVVKRMIKDPLMLWLIAETHSNEEIPTLGFSINNIYKKYRLKLEKEGRLVPGKDILFLTEQLVPLMAENGYYDNKISVEATYKHLVSVEGLDREVPLNDLMYSYDEKRLKTPYIRLLDAGILREVGERPQKTIEFRIERFYEFYLGCHIQNEDIATLPDIQAKLAKFHHIIEKARKVPYFWGVVRQAVLMDKDKEEILKRLAQTDDWFESNMVVDCLTSLARDEGKLSIVDKILSELVNLGGKSKVIENSKAVAIQVAFELCKIPDFVTQNPDEENPFLHILKRVAYDKSEYIRGVACKYIYYLSISNPKLALEIIHNLGEEVKITWRVPRFLRAMQASSIISLLIYCDYFDASIDGDPVACETVKSLREMWQGIILRCKSLLQIMLWGTKMFSKFIVQKEVGKFDAVNFAELKHFFKKLNEDEKNSLVELLPYFKLRQKNLAPIEDTIIEISRRSDVLSFLYVSLLLTAHASIGNMDEILRIFQRVYAEGGELVKGLWSWAFAYIMIVDNSHIEQFRGVMEKYLSDPNGWWVRSETGKEYCSGTLFDIMAQYHKAKGTIDPLPLDEYFEIAEGKPKLLIVVVEAMRSLALYYNKPEITMDFLKQLTSYAPKGDVRTRLIETLSDIRSVYPEAIEELMQAVGDHLTPLERDTIRTSRSSELLGHLLGLRMGYLFLPQAMSKSPYHREGFADAMAVAAKCKNIGVWIDQVIRRLTNLVMGKELLKVMSIEDK